MSSLADFVVPLSLTHAVPRGVSLLVWASTGATVPGPSSLRAGPLPRLCPSSWGRVIGPVAIRRPPGCVRVGRDGRGSVISGRQPNPLCSSSGFSRGGLSNAAAARRRPAPRRVLRALPARRCSRAGCPFLFPVSPAGPPAALALSSGCHLFPRSATSGGFPWPFGVCCGYGDGSLVPMTLTLC